MFNKLTTEDGKTLETSIDFFSFVQPLFILSNPEDIIFKYSSVTHEELLSVGVQETVTVNVKAQWSSTQSVTLNTTKSLTILDQLSSFV